MALGLILLLSLGLEVFALALDALLFAGAFSLTAFLLDFAFGLEVFFFPLLEGFFLTFFNGSPASCDLEVFLNSEPTSGSSWTLYCGRCEQMIPKMEHFQHLFVT